MSGFSPERKLELRQKAALRRHELERFPVHAVGLLAISDLDQLQDWRMLVAAINANKGLRKQLERILEEINDQFDGPHRPRSPGNQVYAYMHFVLDGKVNIQPWWSKVDRALWVEWGFEVPAGKTRPPYIQIYRRFVELEGYWERIRALSETAIRIARSREQRIGQLQMVDGTEQITSAALYHVCQPGECPTGRAGERIGRIGKQPRHLKLNAEDATAHRHAAEQHPRAVDMEKLVDDPAFRDILAGKIDDAYIVQGDGRKPAVLRFRTSSGHWWETRDIFAGVRYYASMNGGLGKFWHGKLQVKLVDHFTGAPLAIIDIPAGTNERDALMPLAERMTDILGYPASALTTDSGHWYDDLSNELLDIGCQPIGGHRANVKPDEHVDDMHGVRCEHCNGPAVEIEHDITDSSSRYRCLLKLTPDCSDRFRKTARDAPRSLGPIPGTSVEYQYMKKCHSNKENAQRTHRSRYQSANKHYDNVPRRISPFVQTLRTQMGILLDWLRVNLRMGSIKVRGFTQRWEPRTAVYKNLIREAEAHLAERELRGFQLPFGAKAAELGVGPPDRPPPLKT